MENKQEQLGVKLDKNYVIGAYRRQVDALTNENIMLNAYVSQIEAELMDLQAKLQLQEETKKRKEKEDPKK